MEQLGFVECEGSVLGWGFFRATCKKYGLDANVFQELFDELTSSDISCNEISVSHEERKWEIVSGYQKAVRRGETAEALRLASAIINYGKEIPYLWRRVCTTAAEDIGYANPLLVAFTVLCATTFTPSKASSGQKKLVYFLTTKLSESVKDRSMCDLSVIQNYAPVALEQGLLTLEEEKIFHLAVGADKVQSSSQVLNYLSSQKWRTEEMGQFFPVVEGMVGGSPLSVVEFYIPETQRIKGIKSYAYDMHTRVGKKALAILSSKEQIKQFFEETPVKDKLKTLGWVIFYNEGGVLDKAIDYDGRDTLYDLAVKAPLVGMGLPEDRILPLMEIVDSMSSVLNEIREYALGGLYV